ncbi:hypothetical protein M9979_10025 [Sphingomonas sp. RP10(2022)]|uniref:Uncharacterized protein n=1 Tax=Sphingomonas liriopis TaxID=2949094 RepID=A0A9X2KR33_9SPHN|nr:hypothetical protein [Sphingomonas liriopis]MCP3735206.1 hypothetical protein [Sphingomonas liriopis]
MLFTTTTQFAALALCLVAGWFFGLASSSGGKKWKARYATEREAHAAYRKQGDTGLSAANARIAELERENARLAKAAEAVPVAAAPTLTERVTGRRQTVARPAYPAGNRPGWFDFGPRTRG